MTCKRTIWKEQEDQLLKRLVDDNGEDDWNLISQQFNKLQKKIKRNPIQCKQRWTKNLNSKIKKTKWSRDEKQKLFNVFLTSKNKWVDISKSFKNRTDRDIKNNFYNSLRKGLRRICKIVKIENGTNKVRDIKSKALIKTILTLQQQIRYQNCGIELLRLIFDISLDSKRQKQILEREGLAQQLKQKIQKLFDKRPISSQQSSNNYQLNIIQKRTGSLGNLSLQDPVKILVQQAESSPIQSQDKDKDNMQEVINVHQNDNIGRPQSISIYIRWQSK